MTFMELKNGNSYLFDTTFFIDAFRKLPIARQFYAHARWRSVSVGYSIITEAELWAGIDEGNFRTAQDHMILLKPFHRYFINVTIARRAGEIRRLMVKSGKSQKSQGPLLPDCLVAATAEYYNLILVSRNSRDFVKFHDFGIAVELYGL